MKDAYSFDADSEGMGQSYQLMYDAYHKIFQRLGLAAQAVEADGGSIGGNFSHEFHVLADSGEDAIASCVSCGYAANVEKVSLSPLPSNPSDPTESCEEIETPDQHTISTLCTFLGISPEKTIKTLSLIHI